MHFMNFIQGCLITSCLNGGSCLPDNKQQTFSCSCQQPWTGDRCKVKKGKLQFYLTFIAGQMSTPQEEGVRVYGNAVLR